MNEFDWEMWSVYGTNTNKYNIHMILNETPNCDLKFRIGSHLTLLGAILRATAIAHFSSGNSLENLFTRWTDPSPPAIATYSTAASFAASQPSCNTCVLWQTGQQMTLGQLIAAWWLCCSRRPSPCPHSAGPSSVSLTVRVTTSHGWQPNRVRFLHRAAK